MDMEELQKKVIESRDARDWVQYHNPKDLAILLMLEAAKLLEIFQWKEAEEVEAIKSERGSRPRRWHQVGTKSAPSLKSFARKGPHRNAHP
jgi:hypothetical protein